MSEHARIARYLAPLTAGEPGACMLQNDAAGITPPPGKQLVLTTDSVIAGTHLPQGASAEALLRKLMRRNLSDIAAMGAVPWRYLLNLHLPNATSDTWWEACATTLAGEQAQYHITLIGGDCTSGATAAHLTMTMLGLAETTLQRSGARAGDDVYVSGTIGDAALWLQVRNNVHFSARYFAPEPRLALGQALVGVAGSCIDISDGLLADAEQLARASACALHIEQARIPLSPEAQQWLQENPESWQPIVSGGDDYELLFTAPVAAREAVAHAALRAQTEIHIIGHVRAGAGVMLLDTNGHDITPARKGFAHA